MKTFIVVGGGLAGCSMAYLLKSRCPESSVKIFESNKLGGLCQTLTYEGINYELGPHILYSGNQTLREFFDRFVVNKEMRFFQKLSVDGTITDPYHYPVAVEDVIRINPGSAVELYNVDPKNPDYSNMENYLISRTGRTAYEYFYKNYNIKQWGIHPRKIETEWISQRNVFLRDSVESVFGNKWQGHPGSYNELFEKLTKNVDVVFEEVTSIDQTKGSVVCASGEYSADMVFNTAPLDVIFEKKNVLGYRGISWVYALLSSDYVLPTYLMSFPNNYSFTRIMEYKHQYPQNAPGKTLVSFDYPFDSKDPAEPLEDSYVKETVDYLKSNFPGKLISTFVVSKRLVYPISERKSIDYFWDLLSRTASDKWMSFGRLGLYSYVSMDTCVDQCFKVLDVVEKWGGMSREERMSFYRDLRCKQT